jgi:hypothetical protein
MLSASARPTTIPTASSSILHRTSYRYLVSQAHHPPPSSHTKAIPELDKIKRHRTAFEQHANPSPRPGGGCVEHNIRRQRTAYICSITGRYERRSYSIREKDRKEYDKVELGWACGGGGCAISFPVCEWALDSLSLCICIAVVVGFKVNGQ